MIILSRRVPRPTDILRTAGDRTGKLTCSLPMGALT